MGRILAISPHLDDGVFSCGALLAVNPHAVMVTVFAGAPGDDLVTPWDTVCGFGGAHQAIASRRAEDRAALAALRAQPCWLDFTDSQYRRVHEIGDIADRLERATREHRPDTILVPFGLFHSDHELVHEAALRLFFDDARRAWFAYEDALYRAIPGLSQRRLRQLADRHVCATPAGFRASAIEPKRRAVECYASQLRGLAAPGKLGRRDILAPERYWRLTLH